MRYLTTSELNPWDGAEGEAGDRTVSGHLKQPREEQDTKIVWLVIRDNEAVGLEVGASIAFKVAKWWFTLRGEHMLMEESLRKS
jgi:hypothetical protein